MAWLLLTINRCCLKSAYSYVAVVAVVDVTVVAARGKFMPIIGAVTCMIWTEVIIFDGSDANGYVIISMSKVSFQTNF